MGLFNGKPAKDRVDGRYLKSLNGFFKFIPFIMPSRVDALNYYEQAFEISGADKWFKRQRAAGYKGMGMLHLIIAAYVRAVAAMPAINRFVAGRRIYAHDTIEVVMAVKRSLTADADETTIKVEFAPTDTIYDVYRKLNKAIDNVRSTDSNGTDEFAERFSHLPRWLARLLLWFIRVLDYFGWLPKRYIDISPFHGSMIITDLGSLGIGPIYHHIYNFGTLPVFISFGGKRSSYELDPSGTVVERKYIDAKFALDERIADGFYFASVFKLISKLIADPSILEDPPAAVNDDVF